LPVVLLVTGLVIFASLEMGKLCQAGGYHPATAWAAFVSAGLILGPWIEMLNQAAGLETRLDLNQRLPLTLLWLTGGVIGAALVILSRKTTDKALPNLAITTFIIMYMGLLGSFVIRIRCLDHGPTGAILVVYFILTVKSGDIGAFFAGKFFGRNKLAPWLSPAKTVEGFLGAIVLAVGVAASGLWLGRDVALQGRWFPGTLAQVFVFGVVIAVAGHLGDLLESACKRDVGAKDSGSLIPSFGGLLDLVDSPLLAAPFAWGLLTSWGAMD
jgi:phosphatidate cytidylyltransferase